MEELFRTHLEQMRAELEMSLSSGTGTSLLFSIRRELLRMYQGVPASLLSGLPKELPARFSASKSALMAMPTFPGPSFELAHTETEQALALLEEIASQRVLHVPPLLGKARLGTPTQE